MSSAQHHAHDSPLGRAFGVGVVALMIALGVCLIAYTLRGAHFAPLTYLVSFEDQLYDIVFEPKDSFRNDAAPVVLVEIDDDAIGIWRSQNPRKVGDDDADYNNAPRALIARLTRAMREAGAAVVYLDFDFRSHLRDREDEEALHTELARSDAGGSVVLAPTFFARPEPANKAAKEPELIELPTILDGDAKSGRVRLVHPLFLESAFGIVDGAAEAVATRFNGETVRRCSAMRAALAIVRKRASDTPCDEAHIDRIFSWKISRATMKLTDEDRLRYLKIPAGWFLAPAGSQATNGEDWSNLKGAIVVVSGTTLWSDDSHDTPVGQREGALLHVNLAYDLQLQQAAEAPLWIELLMEVIVLGVGGLLTIIGFYVFFRMMKPGPRLSFMQHVLRLLLEVLIAILLGVVVFLLAPFAIKALEHWRGEPLRILDGWRFGVLTYTLCAIVVLAIEAITTIADAAGDCVQDGVARFSRTKQPGSPSP